MSGLKFVGVCDVNGAIYVNPRRALVVDVKDFGAFGDGTGGSGADQTAFDAAFAFLSSTEIAGIGYIGGYTIHVPAGHYKLTAEVDIAVNQPVILEGDGQATTLIEWTTICNGFALHSPYGETRIANIVVRDMQLFNSATIGLYAGPSGTYWQPSTNYTFGDVIAFPGNANRLLQCVSAGTKMSNANGTPFGTLWSGDPCLPYLFITGTPMAQYPSLLVQIYGTGVIGSGLSVRFATDGYTFGSVLTPSGTTIALGATGLTLNLQDISYEESYLYGAPPDGAGFGNIVGDIITDGSSGLQWKVIDGGVGLLFENGAQIKIERVNMAGWVLCIANDGCDNFFVDASCNLGNNNGVWIVSANERQNGFPSFYTATTGSGSLSSTPSTVTVGSTTGAPAAGTFYIVGAGSDGDILVTYTSKDATHFYGCTAATSTYNAKAYISIPVALQQASATNIAKVEDTEIFNYGIGIADSGGFNHKFSMVNFEANNTGPGHSTSVWLTGVQGGLCEGITGEGAWRCAWLGQTLPFTGAIQENGTFLDFVRFEGECYGDSAIVLKTGPGQAYKAITFKHSTVNCQTPGVPVCNGIGWVGGFKFEDTQFQGGTGPFDTLLTNDQTGLVLIIQTTPNAEQPPGIGINKLPQADFDLQGSLGLHTRTITGAYILDAGVNPDYAPDHTVLMSGGPYDVTLPPNTTNRKVVLKAIDASAATYTVAPTEVGATIDGASSYAITLKYAAVEFTGDGTNWFVTGSYNGTVI